MVGTPVLGLYAATNPARSGPYLSREHCVDHYAEAMERLCVEARPPTDTSKVLEEIRKDFN